MTELGQTNFIQVLRAWPVALKSFKNKLLSYSTSPDATQIKFTKTSNLMTIARGNLKHE